VSQNADVAAQEVLAGLRTALDPDPERARRKYAVLRRKLVSFFEWSGAASADALAGETLTAAAWKLTDGSTVESVSAACLAIARSILKKQEPAAPAAPPDPLDDHDRLVEAFEAGLDALPDDSRDLVLTYYAGEQPPAIEAKQALAKRLNQPLSQLRLRAHRTRSQLEHSVMAVAEPASEVK
jgi:hypothetical protein